MDVFLAYGDPIVRVVFWGDEIESIECLDPLTGIKIDSYNDFRIYPANLFVTTKDRMDRAIGEIEIDLGRQVEFFQSIGNRWKLNAFMNE